MENNSIARNCSRKAGILSLISVLFLLVAVALAFLIISGNGANGESQSEEDVAGFVIGLLFLLPLALIILIPTSVVNLVWGLSNGFRCLKTVPGKGTVVFSLVQFIVSVIAYGFGGYLFAVIGWAGKNPLTFVFLAVLVGFLVLIFIKYLFVKKARKENL